MIRAHAIEVVRAAEARARAELEDGELMARAAEGLADVAAARLAERDGRTVVALVGAGDNGGDVLYAVELLSDAGFACAVVLLPEGGRDAVHADGLEAVESAGVDIVVVAEGLEAATEIVSGADLVLDGITGIGGRPGLRPEAVALVDAIDDDAWLIAADLASGLDPAGEVAADDSVWADETVTFGTPKPVHLLPAGEAASGQLTVVDIGLEVDSVGAAVERLTHDDVVDLWPVPGPGDDKYSRGVVGIVAGGEAFSGAAVLAVTAAAEAGAGMIRYVGTATPTALVRAAVPEAVHGDGHVQAWVIGPGLDVSAAEGSKPDRVNDSRTPPPPRSSERLPRGNHPEVAAQLAVARAALASDLPVVLDAGGLDLPDLADLLGGRREAPTLLTPHAGELARLLTRLLPEGGAVAREDVERDPLGQARRLADLTGATVLLKGACTLVVSPDPSAAVRSQTDAPAWLATAGAGDVLAGLLGVLLAAGLSPLDAGSLGALVHGVAADRASGGGPLRALAVARAIGPTVRDLLARGRTA